MPQTDWFDDSLGVASVRGALIYSDPLHSVRHDRVMPLWPEEHLVTAELLDRCLLKGFTVLDLGTGSGVFAIQAARKGCRVLAVDCNARAISFAYANAKRNKVAASLETGPLTENQIVFRHNFAAPGSSQKLLDGLEDARHPRLFDAVILTPPYTLSYPPVSPALHAEAGEDGQETFRLLATTAMQLLADGGVIVCNQMSTVDPAGRITAIDFLRDQFAAQGRGLNVIVYPCLKEDRFGTDKFLRQQYEELLAHAKVHNPGLHAEIDTYIRDISNVYPELALFSLIAESAPPGTFQLTTDDSLKWIAAREKRDWDDRIRLHADVIATAVPPRALSLPDLLVPVRDASSVGRWTEGPALPPSDPKATPRDVRRQATRRLGFDLDILDNEDAAPGLDLVVVDAAPISENLMGYAGLTHEMTLWMSSRLRRRLGARASAVINEIAAAWQENTRHQQLANAGLFLHPWFTGSVSASDWTLMQHSVRFRSRAGLMCDALASPEDWFAGWSASIAKPPNSLHVGITLTPTTADGISLFESSLEQLHVAEPMSVAAAIAQSGRFEALIDLPNFRKRRDRLPQLNRAVRERIEDGSLNVFTLLNELPLPDRSLVTELFAADADFCHLRMHRALDHHVLRVLSDDGWVNWSSLGGVPLRIREISDSRRSPGLPEQYRGGAWIYAASCFGSPAESSAEIERIALKASKAIWLNYLDRFALKSAENMVQSALHESWHQLAHLASAVAKIARVTPGVPELICDGTHLLAATLRLFQGRGSNRHILPEPVILRRIINSALLAGQIRLEEKSHLDVAETLRRALAPIRKAHSANSLAISDELQKRLDISIGELPGKWSSLERETRFVVLLFHAVWQAFYHAVEFRLVEAETSVFSITFEEVGEDTLCVEVRNSGRSLEVGAPPPKDVKVLETLASGMLDTTVEGPLYDNGSWIVRLAYRRITGSHG